MIMFTVQRGVASRPQTLMEYVHHSTVGLRTNWYVLGPAGYSSSVPGFSLAWAGRRY